MKPIYEVSVEMDWYSRDFSWHGNEKLTGEKKMKLGVHSVLDSNGKSHNESVKQKQKEQKNDLIGSHIQKFN